MLAISRCFAASHLFKGAWLPLYSVPNVTVKGWRQALHGSRPGRSDLPGIGADCSAACLYLLFESVH